MKPVYEKVRREKTDLELEEIAQKKMECAKKQLLKKFGSCETRKEAHQKIKNTFLVTLEQEQDEEKIHELQFLISRF